LWSTLPEALDDNNCAQSWDARAGAYIMSAS
jgi:hypothetical protein